MLRDHACLPKVHCQRRKYTCTIAKSERPTQRESKIELVRTLPTCVGSINNKDGIHRCSNRYSQQRGDQDPSENEIVLEAGNYPASLENGSSYVKTRNDGYEEYCAWARL